MTQRDSYDRISITLHWLMAFFILALFVSGLVAEAFPRETRRTLLAVHGMAGLAIVGLVAVRIAWRAAHPVAPALGAPVLRLLSRLAHHGLYGLMVLVPLSGWWMISVQGRTMTLFGLTIPHIVDRAPELRRVAEQTHELLAYALVGLAAVHAVAAILHHLVLRDGVLRRMMPGRARASG